MKPTALTTFAKFVVLGLAMPLGGVHAAPFSSGSTGADGPFSPTQDITLQVPPDGKFNYTTITIPLHDVDRVAEFEQAGGGRHIWRDMPVEPERALVHQPALIAGVAGDHGTALVGVKISPGGDHIVARKDMDQRCPIGSRRGRGARRDDAPRRRGGRRARVGARESRKLARRQPIPRRGGGHAVIGNARCESFLQKSPKKPCL